MLSCLPNRTTRYKKSVFMLVDNKNLKKRNANKYHDMIMKHNIYNLLPNIISISCFIRYQGAVGLT